MAIKKTARAKINLCLHITGQRDDGYHLLDSVVALAEFGDVLTFEPADSVSLSVDGPFAAGLAGSEDNLILKSARCFTAATGCAIRLHKTLPVASGIGGGSADAAAAIHGLAEHWQLPLPDADTQLSLGADVAVCVQGTATRMRGIGEELMPISGMPDLHVVLVNPGVAVATRQVFHALATKENSALIEPPVSPFSESDFIDWLALNRNDLEPAAIQIAPVIGNVLAALNASGARLARMSGSGATCFGIFETQKAAGIAAKTLVSAHPDWWVQPTVLHGSDHPGHHEI